MKTSLPIADEKLIASKISFVVFDQRILLININNNILSGIFSRDGPPSHLQMIVNTSLSVPSLI